MGDHTGQGVGERTAAALIWRYSDGSGLPLSASAPIGPDGELPLRAVHEAPSDEVRALGADGLVLALRGLR